MDVTYPKSEKLKSRKTIDSLFAGAQSVAKYPLRLVYAKQDFDDHSNVKVGVSVSKRYFKKATDRNYFKRLLREAYRLNKVQMLKDVDESYAFMILYQSKDRLDFLTVESKMIELFEKFSAAVRK